MVLECLFDREGAGNPYFKQIFNRIFDTLGRTYTEHTFIHIQPDYQNQDISPSSVGGYSNFQIINQSNRKTIVMSFWDRGMDPITMNAGGWEKLQITQYIGGLGMYMTSDNIYRQYTIKHIPYQYPLGVKDSDEHIKNNVTSYRPDEKKRSAIFIGQIYGGRSAIVDILKKHPLFDIYDSDVGYRGDSYFKKLSEYRIGLSMNGNGEFCLRDLEVMGLNLPLFRPELKTTFHNRLIPNIHYIKTSEPSIDAHERFSISNKEIAENYINKVEEYIDNYDELLNVTTNGNNYYLKYVNVDYIVKLFFEILDIKSIENE